MHPSMSLAIIDEVSRDGTGTSIQSTVVNIPLIHYNTNYLERLQRDEVYDIAVGLGYLKSY